MGGCWRTSSLLEGLSDPRTPGSGIDKYRPDLKIFLSKVTRAGILSGSIELLGFKFERSLLMPKELTIMGFIVGNWSFSLKLAWVGGSG